jgi:septum site-determining protein MinC
MAKSRCGMPHFGLTGSSDTAGGSISRMAGNLVQGAVFTVMVVRAPMLRDPAFELALSEQIRRSPRFFLNAPVVLDLKDAAGFTDPAEFAAAKDTLRCHTLMLAGVQNALPAQVEAAASAGLASFAPNSTHPRRPRVDAALAPAPPAPRPEQPPPEAPPAPSTPPDRAVMPAKARLVTQLVRSGTQIYARGADLVVTAAVSPGAEIIADGNIHVYGALRGRALAGAAGDPAARIFCSRFEAELVSIAGRYLVSDQIPAAERGLAVQIALVDDRLTITRN